MIVQLWVVLGEKRLKLVLHARVHHTLLKYVLIFLLAAELEVLFLLKIAVLQQRVIFLPKIWLTIRWLPATCSACRGRPARLSVKLAYFIVLGFHTGFKRLSDHLIHGWALLKITIDEVRQQSREVV